MYWYSGGLYIPTDIYTLYKRSKGLPTCTIFSSHDTLMPAMKAYSRHRSEDIRGLNDKAVVRKFVEYENIRSLQQLSDSDRAAVIGHMKLDFALAALMSSDVMFAAGSEDALFERIDVLRSGPAEFSRGIESDLPEFMRNILQIKASEPVFNVEGTVIPFGCWKPDLNGIRGYVKSTPDRQHVLVAVNNSDKPLSCRIPKRMQQKPSCRLHVAGGYLEYGQPPASIELAAGQLAIITA